MPTLPGRATSILSVLGGFSPTGRRAFQRFDWPSLVADARPGNASEPQRRQALRLASVQGDLASWLSSHSLAADHLEESALYATVTTPPTMALASVMSVARTIAWIYAIDDFIDKPDAVAVSSRAQTRSNALSADEGSHDPHAPRDPGVLPASSPLDARGGATVLSHLDRNLATILAPLASMTRRSVRHAGSAQIRQCTLLADASPHIGALRGSLDALFSEFRALWAPLTSAWGRGRFRLRVAADQLTACVAMMRQERAWNVAAAQVPLAPPMPAFRAYLRGGSLSIGMAAVAVAVAGCEPRSRRTWRAARRATDAAGRIVRLTNDLHTYEADIDEGKVSAVTLRLHALGYAPFGHDPRTSQEVRHAQARVSDDLAHAIADFSRLHTALPPGLLSYYLRHSVAFALAVYGDGGQFAATPVTSP
jgi:hypothetical protein